MQHLLDVPTRLMGGAVLGVPVPIVAVAVLLAGGVAWLVARRAVRAVAATSLSQRRAFLLITVGAAGLLAASYGTIHFLSSVGEPLPVALLISAVVEGGAAALVVDLYARSATPGARVGKARVASWVFAAASCWANVTHSPASTWSGALIFGALPLLGLYLLEYQAGADRRERTHRSDPDRASWPVRVAVATWRRAWTGVATALGVDVNASDTETELALAARRAARATYRLRLALAADREHPTRRTARRVRRATRASQAARERAGVASDPGQAVALAVQVRELVHGPDSAADDWSDVAAAASRVYGSLVVPNRPSTPGQVVGHDGARVVQPAVHGDRTPPYDGARPATLNRPYGRTTPTGTRITHPDKTPDTARTARRTPNRTTPDVSDLIPLGQDAWRRLHNSGQHVTRDRVAAAIRDAGHTVSADRAAALWRELNNGRAPTLD